jgi:hypothetical protein
MIRALVLAAALVAAPQLAAAQSANEWAQAGEAFARKMTAEGRVVLRLGERIVVRLDENNKAMVETTGPASNGVLGDGAPTPDGALAFTLGMDAKAGWVLKTENGAEQPIAYGALIAVPMGANLGLATTSTCSVPSGVVGLESWQNEVVMIALGPFAPRPEGASQCETLAKPPGGALPVAAAGLVEAG